MIELLVAYLLWEGDAPAEWWGLFVRWPIWSSSCFKFCRDVIRIYPIRDQDRRYSFRLDVFDGDCLSSGHFSYL